MHTRARTHTHNTYARTQHKRTHVHTNTHQWRIQGVPSRSKNEEKRGKKKKRKNKEKKEIKRKKERYEEMMGVKIVRELHAVPKSVF